MFASAKRELRSERTLLGAVVLAGVSVGLLLVLIMARSDSVGSPSETVAAENFTIDPPSSSVTPSEQLPAIEQVATEVQSVASARIPSFPGMDFSVTPTAQVSQTQPSESNATASMQDNSNVSAASEPTVEQNEVVDSDDDIKSEEPAVAVQILAPDGTPIALPGADESASPFASAGENDSVVSSSPFSSAPVVPVEPDPEPKLVGPTKLLPEASVAIFLPEASEMVGDSILGDSTFDNDSLKEAVKAVITTVWDDLSMAGTDVFSVPNSRDTLNFYRSQIGASDWMLYADIEGTSSALMYVLDDQTLVIATLDVRQMQLMDQESEGIALMLFDNA